MRQGGTRLSFSQKGASGWNQALGWVQFEWSEALSSRVVGYLAKSFEFKAGGHTVETQFARELSFGQQFLSVVRALSEQPVAQRGAESGTY